MRNCNCCSGDMDMFMELNPKTELWVCDRCHRVFIKDERGVMHDHIIKKYYPQKLIRALNTNTGKRVE